MPTYHISVPGSGTYEVSSPTELTDEQAWMAVQGQLRAAPEPKQESGLLSTIGSNLLGGFKSTALGAGAAGAHYLGAEEKAKEWDAARQKIQEDQAAHGGDSFVGKVANVVGSMAPALVAAPFTGGSSLALGAVNAGLFAIPAFRDTYNARKAEGDSDDLAVAQALREAGLAQFGGHLIGKGGTAVGNLLSKNQGALKQLGVAGLEGAGFSAASTASEKAMDLAAGKKNEHGWIDPEDMAVQATGFGLLRVPRLRGKPAEAAPEEAPRSETALTPEQEAALDARLKAREEARAPMRPASEVLKEAADAARIRQLPAPEREAPARPEVMDKETWAKGPKAPDRATPEEMKAEEARATEAPSGFTHEDLAAFGTPYGKAAQAWADKNLIGKTVADVKAMVDADPSLTQGRSHVAALLREIIAPEPTKYEATPPDLNAAPRATPAATPDNAPTGAVAGLLGGPSREVAPESVPKAQSDRDIPAATDVGKPDGGEGKQPTALTEPPAPAPEVKPAPSLGKVLGETPKANDPLNALFGRTSETEKPADVTETPEAKQAEAQGQEPAAPAEPVAPKAEAPARDLKADIDARMDEIRALQDQQQALLQSNGRIPAPKSKARAKWDALDAEIAAKRAQVDPLIAEEAKQRAAQKAETVEPPKPAEPPAEPPKPVESAPKVIDSKEAADAALQEILNDRAAPIEVKRRASEMMEAMDKGSEDYAGDMDTAADSAALFKQINRFVEDERAARAERPDAPQAPRMPDITSKAEAEAVLDHILRDASVPKAVKWEAISFLDLMDKNSEHYTGDMDTKDGRDAVFASIKKFAESAKAKRFNVGEAHPEGTALHPDALRELHDNNLVGALHHIAKNSESKFARAVAERLKHLLGNTHVHLHDNLKTDKGESARGAASSDGHHIWLHTKHGMDEATLLHESVHAATERILQMESGKLTQAQRDAIGELKSLWNAAKQDKAINLSPDARASLSEFVAEGMANADLQKALQAKPWKSQTRWDGFKRVILKMLGVAQPKSMLDMHAAAVDTIFSRPEPAYENPLRKFSISRDMQDIIDNSGAQDPATKSLLQKAIDGFSEQHGVRAGEKFRTQFTDIAASIESRINKGGNGRAGFDGAVRDAMGRMNPMGLYRQAQDYAKMILSYLEKGSLIKDSTTGLWKTEKGEDAPLEVYKKLKAWGLANGKDYAQASLAASRILEGVRLYHIRESNRTGATSIPLHSIDRESKNPPSIDFQIDEAMRNYKANPELQEISRVMDAARIKLIDHMVAVGRLSKEQGKEWASVAGYVPFDRVVEFADRLTSHKRIGSRTPLGVGKLPELLGSDIHRVGNVFDNYMNTMGWMMGQIMHTDARNQTLKTLEAMGYAKRMGFHPNGARNATYGFENGAKVYYNLPSKYDVMAFKDLTAPKGQVVKFLGQFSNVLRTTVTALPPFALKQVTDDIQRAIMTSGVKNPLMLIGRTLSYFPRIAWAEFTGKGHPEMEGLGSYGVTGGFDFLDGKPAANLLADLGYKPRGWLADKLHRLEGITRASDFAVRKAVYDQTLAESGGDTLLAQTRARELINFRRRGASDFVATATATIPFFNAYVQGMDVLLRAATGKGAASSIDRSQARAMFLSRAAIAVGLSTMYALAKADDEEYQNVDLRTRNNNWLLGNGMKLPVPGELGALFKSIPEHIVEYYRREGTPEEQTAMEAIKTSMGFIFEQFGGRVVPIPQGVKPLIEAFTNHSFLTGNQLEGIHQAGMLPHMRTNERTSELATQIAKFAADQVGVEVSPIMIDNVLQGYFGSTAAMTTMMTDQLLNPDRMDRPLNKYALLSNYMLDPVGTRRVGEFYDERERVFQLQNTMNELAKKDPYAAEKFVDAHQQELATYSAVNATLQQLEKTRAYKNYLSGPAKDDMSKAEREDEMLQVRKMEAELTGWLREAKTELRRNPG